MKILWFAIASVLFTACTTGVDLKSVDYNHLFNDGNSKVWLITKQIIKGVDITNPFDQHKDLLIFYDTGELVLCPVQGFGRDKSMKGHYLLDSDNREIDLHFNGQQWHMTLDYITEDSIFMRHTKSSDNEFDFQIKPLPVIVY